MLRPVISLWQLWMPCILLGGTGCLPWLISPQVGFIASFWSLIFLVNWIRVGGWLWRLLLRVRSFETRSCDRVVFHYPSSLRGAVDFTFLRDACESALDEHALLFGFTLRRRVAVFLLPTSSDMTGIFGRPWAGMALCPANAIVLTMDGALSENIVHETAHLFAWRLNPRPLPLLREGLAVWLQGTMHGVSVQAVARSHAWATDTDLNTLSSRLDCSVRDLTAYYAFAGSFVNYLIWRFGWAKVKRFYSNASSNTFKKLFDKTFGECFSEVEYRWRRRLLVGSCEFSRT